MNWINWINWISEESEQWARATQLRLACWPAGLWVMPHGGILEPLLMAAPACFTIWPQSSTVPSLNFFILYCNLVPYSSTAKRILQWDSHGSLALTHSPTLPLSHSRLWLPLPLAKATCHCHSRCHWISANWKFFTNAAAAFLSEQHNRVLEKKFHSIVRLCKQVPFGWRVELASACPGIPLGFPFPAAAQEQSSSNHSCIFNIAPRWKTQPRWKPNVRVQPLTVPTTASSPTHISHPHQPSRSATQQTAQLIQCGALPAHGSLPSLSLSLFHSPTLFT